MTSRRRYLVCYDISHPRRLHMVHSLMKRYGYPLQNSVFLSDLDAQELLALRQDLSERIHNGEDSVLLADLGDSVGPDKLVFMGRRPFMPKQGPVIV
ncbi:MAG: CRISPR-associated endonuclease Cas2 [Acidimicrobiales bacterium]